MNNWYRKDNQIFEIAKSRISKCYGLTNEYKV